MINCEKGGMNNNCKCCNNYNTYGEDFGFDVWSEDVGDEDDAGKIGWDENAWWAFDLGGGENVKNNKAGENEKDGFDVFEVNLAARFACKEEGDGEICNKRDQADAKIVEKMEEDTWYSGSKIGENVADCDVVESLGGGRVGGVAIHAWA